MPSPLDALGVLLLYVSAICVFLSFVGFVRATDPTPFAILGSVSLAAFGCLSWWLRNLRPPE